MAMQLVCNCVGRKCFLTSIFFLTFARSGAARFARIKQLVHASAVRMSKYWTFGRFGELKGLASCSRLHLEQLLRALQTSRVPNISTYALLKHELIVKYWTSLPFIIKFFSYEGLLVWKSTKNITIFFLTQNTRERKTKTRSYPY